jgi:citronellol/citronellal dehydrogenase
VDLNLCRKPEILADAAWFILTSDATLCHHRQLLHRRRTAGQARRDRPGQVRGGAGHEELHPDFFVD